VTENATTVDSLHELLEYSKALRMNPAFQHLQGVMRQQMDGRRRESSLAMKNMEEALERNFMNGEAAGLDMALRLPELLEEGWRDEMNRRIAERDAAKDDKPQGESP
jgi:hypothetical protein